MNVVKLWYRLSQGNVGEDSGAKVMNTLDIFNA